MSFDSNSMKHSSGFVNIIGNPNVGKSTLMNAWMGEKISIITSKAQTTRHRILGILNAEDFQMVLSDTPGVIKPAYNLQKSMMNFVKSAFQDADILVYLVEVGEQNLKDKTFFEKIKNTQIPLFVLINKIDCSCEKQVIDSYNYWNEKLPHAKIFTISALMKFNINEVLEQIKEHLPKAPPFFPKDQITDKPERFFVNECVREKIILHYKKEIPYAVEIETESFLEQAHIIKIRAIIMVERNSQKGIIIGHKGNALKRIGTEARKDLEKFFGKKIFLELYVKVNKNWKSNANQLRRFGYNQ